MKPKAILCYSGGMDSTVLLYDLLHRGFEIQALSVDYGQRHKRELLAAEQILERNGIMGTRISLGAMPSILGGSSLTDPAIPVPYGHYTDASMKQTVVPNRNMLLLAFATAMAIAQGAQQVAYAAHAGDHAIYPDCRPEFVEAMRDAIGLSTGDDAILLYAPFLYRSKAYIAAEGARLGAPLELTWSCYEGGEIHCGQCGTCVERKEAFREAGVPDLTIYRN